VAPPGALIAPGFGDLAGVFTSFSARGLTRPLSVPRPWSRTIRQSSVPLERTEHRSSVFAVLGLPYGVRACLFDLDGVLTKTAEVHAAAWKEMFDAFIRSRSSNDENGFVPFDLVADYDEYVDGKPRFEGVEAFLASRRIRLPRGDPGDSPDADTIAGLGNRKNEILLRLIREQRVEAYEGSVRYVRAAAEQGLSRGVVSSSANAREVLIASGIQDLFEVRIDGFVATREHLRGKPAPDTFLAAARALGAEPREAVVVEDALAGVAAGKAGGFGFVVGVDRVGQRNALLQRGADLVVADLAELLPER
jgi:beta-phosphoglucomutase family hydrolase